jgi:hypothetical protein
MAGVISTGCDKPISANSTNSGLSTTISETMKIFKCSQRDCLLESGSKTTVSYLVLYVHCLMHIQCSNYSLLPAPSPRWMGNHQSIQDAGAQRLAPLRSQEELRSFKYVPCKRWQGRLYVVWKLRSTQGGHHTTPHY